MLMALECAATTDSFQTDTVVTHPDVVFYDFYAAYDTPNTTDTNNYLSMWLAKR
jgi:hypothetical protein